MYISYEEFYFIGDVIIPGSFNQHAARNVPLHSGDGGPLAKLLSDIGVYTVPGLFWEQEALTIHAILIFDSSKILPYI